MTVTAATLLVLSAITHSGWNLISKRSHPSTAYILVANTIGALLVAPVLVLYGRALPMIPATVWWLLGVTTFCQAIYYAALAGAYRNGDLSLAYPLARSLPVVLVALATQILGLGERLGAQAFAGIALVAVGALILPMEHFKDFRLRNYLTTSALLAGIAALGTSGYSIIDSEALRLMRAAPGSPLSPVETSLLYLFLEGILSSVWLCPVVLGWRRERVSLARVMEEGLCSAVLTGAGIYVTYGLVLVAMAFVTNVSYVVVLRQLSIPLGALLGILVLREPCKGPRVVGACVMFFGVTLVGIG